MATVDLHVHSTGSDGSRSPSWLVERAIDSCFAALSLTDHDTFSGVPEAGAAALNSGLLFIPGVELSVELHCGGSAHMLGYFPGSDPRTWDGGTVETALESVRLARDARNTTILQRLNDLGVPITSHEVRSLAGEGVTGRLHIATVLLQKGVVGSIEQAFGDYLRKSAPAYVPRERIGDYRAMSLIRENGGISVLAHPWLIEGRGEREIRALVSSLSDGGLMGVEAYYPSHDPAMTSFLVRTADEFDLMVTGGSDYHGVEKRDVFPPKNGGFRVDSDQVGAFLEVCADRMKGDRRHGKTQ